MERRAFVGAAVAGVYAATGGAAAENKPAARQFYELQQYALKAEKQPILDEYLRKAYIPAAKRAGAGPIGVFLETAEAGAAHIYVLTVHPSAATVTQLPELLAADKLYQVDAADYLAAKASEPVYSRIESSLFNAIVGMPVLEKPDTTKPRLLNLRIYESHNERAAARKVEMFEKGELAIFRRVGLTPVLFASARIGALLPNLTYLLVFADDAERKAAWDRFRVDPDWLKLRAIPEYADKEIVSRITNKLLTPTSYSEI